jgi:hypothetical protein
MECAGCSKGCVLATDTSMQKVTYATGQGRTKLLYNTRVVQYHDTFDHSLFLKTKNNYDIVLPLGITAECVLYC